MGEGLGGERSQQRLDEGLGVVGPGLAQEHAQVGAPEGVGAGGVAPLAASVALDLSGVLGVEQRPLSVGTAAGAAAVLAGITVVVRSQTRAAAPAAPSGGGGVAVKAPSGGDGRPPPLAGWVVLGLAAGAELPVQGAVNALLRGTLVEPLAVAVVSFTVATPAIAAVLAALLATGRTPRPRLAPLRHMPWWGWLGGACAAGYVTGTFLLIPQIGAAVTVALSATGLQLTSAAVDQYGLFRLPKRPVTPPRAGGLALLGSFAHIAVHRLHEARTRARAAGATT